MIVNNQTCSGLDSIPSFLPAALLFAVFGVFLPWAIMHLPGILKREKEKE